MDAAGFGPISATPSRCSSAQALAQSSHNERSGSLSGSRSKRSSSPSIGSSLCSGFSANSPYPVNKGQTSVSQRINALAESMVGASCGRFRLCTSLANQGLLIVTKSGGQPRRSCPQQARRSRLVVFDLASAKLHASCPIRPTLLSPRGDPSRHPGPRSCPRSMWVRSCADAEGRRRRH